MNKVSTAVELRFEAARSPNLPEPVKNRLRRLAGRRWTKEGAVVIQVEETRSQARNRDRAGTAGGPDPESHGKAETSDQDETDER